MGMAFGIKSSLVLGLLALTSVVRGHFSLAGLDTPTKKLVTLKNPLLELKELADPYLVTPGALMSLHHPELTSLGGIVTLMTIRSIGPIKLYTTRQTSSVARTIPPARHMPRSRPATP